MAAGWFEVDKEGLARLQKRKGPSFILYEMAQNSWDTKATKVVISLEPVPNHSLVKFRVEDDDPDGFKFLEHGYMLFAESIKKGDPEKRGRFNLGEKLVLAVCESAKLASTTGTVYFGHEGKELTRRQTRERREQGTVFEAEVRMTRAELAEVLDAAKLLLPPIPTVINGEILPVANPIRTFEATLATEIADEEGYLKKTARKTQVRVHAQANGVSYLYEMGIPVVEIDLPWSIEIMQKIPLNSDRDNVTPAYRKTLAVLVLNEMHTELAPEHARLPIVQEALESPDTLPEAVQTVLTHQYGEKRAVFDPSDAEANAQAFANGYNVIPGGAFSKAQWASIRRAEAASPSGRLFPTPQTYNPNGDPARIYPESEWTEGMKAVAIYAKALAQKLMATPINITMEKELTQRYGANYGHQHLTFNVPRLGKKWFDLGTNSEAINSLLVHEFGHEYESNHLSDDYYKALTRLGAKMVTLALNEPEFFKRHGIPVNR